MFRFITAGESHGKALITIVEGLPSGLFIDKKEIDHQLWRRQQGYGRSGRMKIETDTVEILSGIRHGKTLGSPICLVISNKDHWQESMAIEPVEDITEKILRPVKSPRPGHADLAGGQKYNTKDFRNILERASARETAARVAAGTLARIFLRSFNIEIASHTIKLGDIPKNFSNNPTWDHILEIQDNTTLRCVDSKIESQMISAIDLAKKNGDTIGGTFEIVVRGLPIGLGNHTQWDLKLDGKLAQAIMSIQAIKAVEIGNGVQNSSLNGSEVHDEIFFNEQSHRFTRLTNRAGGIEGGITNGEELRIRGYLKPISTLRQPLQSIHIETKEIVQASFERSDITAVPAAGVIGEAMVAMVLADAMKKKFGGDSLQEIHHNVAEYLNQLRNY